MTPESMRPANVLTFLVVLPFVPACGGSAPGPMAIRTAPHAQAHAPRRMVDVWGEDSAMQTAGLTGSLAPSEIGSTLRPREEPFSACFATGAGRLRALGGQIRLNFRIDEGGRVQHVFPVDSTVGHREIEECLLDVAYETHFPRPHGGQAEFSWFLSFEAADPGRVPVTWDASRVRRVVVRRSGRVLSRCRPSSSTATYQVTAYVGRSGRIISAGAAVSDPDAVDGLDCVVEAVSRWRLPRGSRQAKVTFLLR